MQQSSQDLEDLPLQFHGETDCRQGPLGDFKFIGIVNARDHTSAALVEVMEVAVGTQFKLFLFRGWSTCT
jgi:hypothetical protein